MKRITGMIMLLLLWGCTNPTVEHLMEVNTALTHERAGLEQSVLTLESAYGELGRETTSLRAAFANVERQLDHYGQQVQALRETSGMPDDATGLVNDELRTRLHMIEEQLQRSFVRQERLDRGLQGLVAKIQQSHRKKVSKAKSNPQKSNDRATRWPPAIDEHARGSRTTKDATTKDDVSEPKRKESPERIEVEGFTASSLQLPAVPALRDEEKAFTTPRDMSTTTEANGTQVVPEVPDPVVADPPSSFSSGPVSLQSSDDEREEGLP